MAAWHFLRQLSFAFGAHSPIVSRRLIRFSPSALDRCFSAPFVSTYRPRNQWPCHFIAAKFSTSSSSEALAVDDSIAAPYLSVLIHCPKDVADVLAEALLCFGASSASMDEDDGCESTDEMCINSIFPEDEDINMCISHAADSIGLKEIPRYEVKIGEQDDWLKRAQESFYPVEITKNLWVVPKWRTPPDLQATNIILNPGLAFGTGEHPTTKLCLLLLCGCIKGGEHILDYGTGSGILAIAALKIMPWEHIYERIVSRRKCKYQSILKFGAAFAVGIDVDSQATASASENAALNNIGPEKMQLYLIPKETSPPSLDEKACGVLGEYASEIDIVNDKDKFDVVMANILLNPLLDLADQIISSAKPGSIVGLSGILTEQIPSILQKYSPFLEEIEVSEMDDWACVSGRKKKSECVLT